MNFIETAISNGFKSDIKDFSAKNNFYGASLYHPDVTLSKGDKKIYLSCNGFFGTSRNVKTKKEGNKTIILESNPVKFYIGLEDKTGFIYESFKGIPPSKEITNKLI